jgi:hypothetical protein
MSSSVVIGVAAIAFAACGGSDAMTLEEYFEEFQTTNNEFEERADKLFEEVDDTDPDALKQAFRDTPPLIDEFIDELQAMDPPSEAADAHNEAVEAGRVLVQEYEAFVEDFDDTDGSLDELLEVLEGIETSALGDALEEFGTACEQLQTIADDNEIEVDLECEDTQ